MIMAKNSDMKKTGGSGDTSRREFLKLSALGAASTMAPPALAGKMIGTGERGDRVGTGNTMPGRIIIAHDPAINAHTSTIDADLVERYVHNAVKVLTGVSETGPAFESLFPGVQPTSTIVIKVNCIGSTCTRWETARGVVSGLAQMFGGTYDVSQVTLFDRHNIGYFGYTADRFEFGGNTVFLSTTNNASGSGYQPYPGYSLSRYLLNSDYLIDIPALKSHSDGNNQITVALKNHYGSCYPSSLCGNITGMLTLNSDEQIRDKTCLVVTCGLRGTYNGGPGESPQYWSNYAEQTPNTMLIGTDPVTNDYWARDLINAERANHGMAAKPCPWIEEASEAQWDIGVSDPGAMTVIPLESSAVEPVVWVGGTQLAAAWPNPFTERTNLSFNLDRAASVSLDIVDVQGRRVRSLTSSDFPAGASRLIWDGRNQSGRPAPSGVYFAVLRSDGQRRSRRIVLAR
jgi:hypothetical protein